MVLAHTCWAENHDALLPFTLEVFSCCCFSWDWGRSFLSPVGGRSRRRGEVKLSRISSSLVRALWGGSLLRLHITEEKGTGTGCSACHGKFCKKRQREKWIDRKKSLCKTLPKSGFVCSCIPKLKGTKVVIIYHLSTINKDNNMNGAVKVKTELLPFLVGPKHSLFFLGVVFITVKSECIH